MKALIENKNTSRWLLAVGIWLAAWTAQAETPLPYSWAAPEESLVCGLVCPANITVNTDPGFCDVFALVYTVTITDPGTCIGPLTQLSGLPSGAIFPLGVTVNSFEIEGPGGFENCSFTVTVVDAENPTIVDCPTNIVVNTDPGFCDAQVFWLVPVATDNCVISTFTSTHNSGDIFPTGITTVTYTATDGSANVSTCTFDIEVTDAEAPQIFTCNDPGCTLLSPGCPFSVFVNNDPGLCSAVVTWEQVITQDNCPGATIISSHAPGSIFPTGFTTVTYTTTDAAGNSSSCSFDVFVEDAEPPVLTCPDITVNNDPGLCGAAVAINPVVTDNCGVASVTSFPPSGSFFGWGTTSVTVIATDNSGFTEFCSFVLTVNDAEPPVINNCPTNITVNNGPFFCGAFVNWTPLSATDNCSFANLLGSHSPGDFFPVGTTTVSYDANDLVGNTSNCTFAVTVADNEPPILSFCPADVTVATGVGACDATVTWAPPLVTDNCGAATVTSSHNPGDIFNLGTTLVAYTATDAAGNVGNCTFNVTVGDFEAPVILNCPANIVAFADPGTCTATVNWTPPTATDNCGLASFGSANSPGDPFPVGGAGAPFTVIYTAIDNAGLTTNCFFEVEVIDNQAPVMTGCPSNINTTTSATFGICAGIVSWTDPVFTDNCGIGLSGSSHINGGYFPTGTTTVTIFASDFWGNTTNCIFNITIVDDEPPEIIPCPSNYIVDTDPGVCEAVVAWTPLTVFENCGVFTTTSTHNPGDVFPLGTTTVTFTATDDAGLSSSCIFNIIVSDNEAPTIANCPVDIVVNADPGACSAIVNWPSPAASDNCNLATFNSNHLPGEVFPTGTTLVTYSATDAIGNVAVCQFNVSVTDSEAPVFLSCPASQTVSVNNAGCTAIVNWVPPLATDNCNINSLTSNHLPGEAFPAGPTLLTYTVLDDAGNAATCNFTITVLNGAVTTTNLTESICDGESFMVGASTYTLSGNYQDTLTSSLGCDSIVNLSLTVLSVFTTNLTESICDGESFTVGASTYTLSGNYQDTLTSSFGCDSIVNLSLTVLPGFTTNLTESICDGESYVVGGSVYTASGNYLDTLTSNLGCDSIVNLNLTVLPVFTTNLTESICNGESYMVGASVYSASGSYQDTLTSSLGCDSIVNLSLTVFPVFTTNLTESICDGESYVVGPSTYTVSGNYQDTLASSLGCDSIVNLNLTVLPVFTMNLVESICNGESYMVGASTYTLSGNYQDTLASSLGCDSIVNLGLTVLPVFTTNLVESICDGESFMVGASVYSASGNYQDTLTSSFGCDSIVNLNLTVFPVFTTNLTESICDGESYVVGTSTYILSGNYQDTLMSSLGCDSIVNLNLTVFPVFTTNLTESICDGESLTVGTSTYTLSGNYQDTLMSSLGCDSIVNLNLTVLPVFTTNLTESICDGESFTVGASTYTLSGNYQDTLASSLGCDSIVNLNLTVLPVFTMNLVESICNGESFTVGTSTYTLSGNYQDTLTSSLGCDSIVNLNLTVLPVFTANLTESICDGESYMVGGSVYSASGSYQDTLTSDLGCDSIVNLSLTVLPVFTTNLVESICDGDSFTVGGSVYSVSGNYQDTLTSSFGCDSIVNLNLTVLSVFTTNLTESICDGESFTVGASTYILSGNYQDTLTSSFGCDSIVNLNLTVLPVFTTNLVESICDGESYMVGGSVYSDSGSYQDILASNLGCDSIVNLNLLVLPVFTTNLVESICDGDSYMVGGSVYSASGNYQDILASSLGCDSIVNLNLAVLPFLQTDLDVQICQGESYQVGNQVFTQTGSFGVTLQSSAGCDSIVNLSLTVLPFLQTQTSVQLCQGDSIFISGDFQTLPGTYFDTLSAVAGCDSIVQTDLLFFQPPTAQIMGPTTLCLGFSLVLGAGVFQSYLWSPGGETSAQITVDAPGLYAVTVSDQNGCTAADAATIVLENCSMVSAGFTVSQDTACASHFVQFSNQSSANATSLHWDFGNGSHSDELNPYTVYPFPGNYTVQLIASDGTTADTSEQQVFVYPKIQAAFNQLVVDVCQPKSLVFNDNSQGTFGLSGWLWNFGDGVTGTGANLLHTFTNFDTVNVTHVVFDQFGCTDSINQNVVVADLGFVPQPVHLCLNLCEGDSLMVGGEVFNAAHPSGSGTLQAVSGCDSTVTVELTFSPLSTFSLGADLAICENETAMLDAGAGDTFLWSTGDATQSIMVSQPGVYTVTVADGTGCPEVGSIQLTTDSIPNEQALAGLDKSICETTAITTLAAGVPQFSTGTWTTAGSASINNVGNPATTVSNLSVGQNLFVWTLGNGACHAFASDTVLIDVVPQATDTAQAGEDLSFCNSVAQVSLQGAASQNLTVTGQWSQPGSQAQLGVEILEPDNPQSPVTGLYPNNTYLFTWTLTNGVCGAYSADNVLVSTYAGLLPGADAGQDVNLCNGTEAQLAGNLPNGTFGEWSSLDAGSTAFIAQPFQPSTLVGDLAAGSNAFVWTLSSNECPAYSADTILVFQSEGLAANADVYFNLGQPLTRLDFLANDDIPDRDNVTLGFLSTPLYGSLQANGDGSFDFTFGVDTTENIEFTYEICLKSCPDVCSQADVVILSKTPVLPPPPIQKPSNVITPNGDGTGDRLAIPNFDEILPPIELLVVNRWGDLVFHSKNYQNDWDGKTDKGKQLPDGTYYFILKGSGSEVNGAVTIVR
ncbi:MAG: HYR domain-containing protein [Saprospiraceae bacterium]